RVHRYRDGVRRPRDRPGHDYLDGTTHAMGHATVTDTGSVDGGFHAATQGQNRRGSLREGIRALLQPLVLRQEEERKTSAYPGPPAGESGHDPRPERAAGRG